MENRTTYIYTLSKKSHYGKGLSVEILNTYETYEEARKAAGAYLEMHAKKKIMFIQQRAENEAGAYDFVKEYRAHQRPRTKRAKKAIEERRRAKMAARIEKAKQEMSAFDLPLEATEEGRAYLAKMEETEKVLGIE